MSLLRLYTHVPDQDEPRLTGDARRVLCDVVEISADGERRVAVTEVRIEAGAPEPIVTIQQQAGPPQVIVLSPLGAALFDTGSS